ncbi:hypothetical protein QNG98_gp02 [Yersinia phage PYps3T]|uniref:Uncharacterized protein n=1 Tax=Yersinia phage PYps3T TaxID=2801357 RepID=A0AAE7PA08_9CAUD|nr:hypothetical protein QNG98_gp02 [Yersinia phage PYps3T]QQO91004.1 hypothetical protein ORF002 [Yersinia phage PYps3T]QQO91089.1 hypothetical protein ORF002 [Yersinia phage PYps4T]QQO91259.1 hypothetical protein ORF002 [Yersinia phage PYps16T]
MLSCNESCRYLSHDVQHTRQTKLQFRITFLLHTWLLELCPAKDREFNDCHIITTLCV